MLGVALAHVLGLDEGAAAIEVQLVAELVVKAPCAGPAPELQQGCVEVEIRGIVGCGLGGAPSGVHPPHQGTQRGELRGRAGFRQARAGQPRDGGADVVDLKRFLGADLAHIGALVAYCDDKAAALEPAHRFAHRPAGDAEPGGERGLVQALPGGEAAGQDHSLDLLRDEGGE